MTFPIQITAKDPSIKEPIEALIQERALKLERFAHRILHARAVIDTQGAHPAGHHFKLEIKIKGHEVVVERGPTHDLPHAIRDAFDAARRQLQDYDAHHHLADKH